MSRKNNIGQRVKKRKRKHNTKINTQNITNALIIMLSIEKDDYETKQHLKSIASDYTNNSSYATFDDITELCIDTYNEENAQYNEEKTQYELVMNLNKNYTTQ